MKSLIIAEKPSVARRIASAVKATKKREGYFENDNYLITWAYGHLLRLGKMKEYDSRFKKWKIENYPYIPDPFMFLPNDEGDMGALIKKQIGIINDLIKEQAGEIISATDNDREGQVIADSLLEYLGYDIPVKRLLLNDWTESNIKKGLESLIPNSQLSGLKDSGYARMFSDWIIGINLTGLTTLKYGNGLKTALRVGRVLVPTLKLVYDRDKAIEEFKPEDFYKLTAIFTSDNVDFDGVYKQEDGTEKFKENTKLKEIQKEIKGLPGIVKSIETKAQREYPEPLFNQTNLQGEIVSKNNGWTAEKVLEVAQRLYERGFISYPRTASRHLQESYKEECSSLINKLASFFSIEEDFSFSPEKRVFDDKKVDSHPAIIPTMSLAKKEKLSEDEWIVYKTIIERFLSQFLPPAVFNKTKAVINVGGYDFHVSGKVLEEPGFKPFVHEKTEDSVLPPLKEGDQVELKKTSCRKSTTKPPKPLSEKELLHLMESCGRKYKSADEEIEGILSGFSIGTDATRADAISRLIETGYIERKRKQIRTTELGKNLIEIFPVKELLDLEFTGRLEYRLKQIEKGEESRDNFLKDIEEFVLKASQEIKEADLIALVSTKNQAHKCPVCGAELKEYSWGFGCSNYRTQGCGFKLFKTIAKKTLTDNQVKTLLEKGETPVMKGFISKKGKKFSAALKIEGDRVVFKFPPK